MTELPPELPPPPPSGGGGFSILHSSPPSDPVLVLILNLLLAGGGGYFLIGQKPKAIVAIALFFATGFPTCFAASVLIAIISAIDGYLQARTLEAGRPIGQWTFFESESA